MTQMPTDPNPSPPTPQEPGLDAAQQSLSDALRVSFGVLKVLMVVLFVVYIFSGVARVDEQNTAVRYRLGEPVAKFGSGWHFGLPFPIERVVMVPSNTQSVLLDQSFWYDNPDDRKPEELAFEQLDPLKDSFLITGDTNVVHVQFTVNYVITQEGVDDYLRNVGSLERAEELVQMAAERGMIHAIASSKIDNIVKNSDYPDEEIKFKTQQVLTDLGTGITVQDILIDLTNQSMPNQVREAYIGVTQAQADKVKTIQEARQTYDEQLGRTAGGAHEELLTMINAYEAALGYQDDQLATALRSEIDRSIDELVLPDRLTLEQMQAYFDTGSDAGGNDDPDRQAAYEQSRQTLAETLNAPAQERTYGPPISGEISSMIIQARANRTQITTRAQTSFEKYQSALKTFETAPLIIANKKLQEAREKIIGQSLVQTYIGRIPRIDTTMDPEGSEELANQAFINRRQKAEGQGENE